MYKIIHYTAERHYQFDAAVSSHMKDGYVPVGDVIYDGSTLTLPLVSADAESKDQICGPTASRLYSADNDFLGYYLNCVPAYEPKLCLNLGYAALEFTRTPKGYGMHSYQPLPKTFRLPLLLKEGQPDSTPTTLIRTLLSPIGQRANFEKMVSAYLAKDYVLHGSLTLQKGGMMQLVKYTPHPIVREILGLHDSLDEKAEHLEAGMVTIPVILAR